MRLPGSSAALLGRAGRNGFLFAAGWWGRVARLLTLQFENSLNL